MGLEQTSSVAGVGLVGKAEWGFCLLKTGFKVWLLAG